MHRLRRKEGQKRLDLIESLWSQYLKKGASKSLGALFRSLVSEIRYEDMPTLPPSLEVLSAAVSAHVESTILRAFLLSPDYAALLKQETVLNGEAYNMALPLASHKAHDLNDAGARPVLVTRTSMHGRASASSLNRDSTMSWSGMSQDGYAVPLGTGY